MTTDLELRFPLGRFHANPWGRHVNEGEVEWPPSAWRVLRALISVWHERAPELDPGLVQALLEHLADPPSYLLPDASPSSTRHYYPDGKVDAKSSWAEGTDKALDSFVVLAPGQPLVVRWHVDLGPAERQALDRLARLLPYVGRADAVCEARLLDDEPVDAVSGRWLHPIGTGGDGDGLTINPTGEAVGDVIDLLVPLRPLDLDGLQIRTRQLRGSGLLEPPAARRVAYPRPPAPLPASPRPRRVERMQCLTFALDAPALPSIRLAVLVADTLRAASQHQFGDEPPPVEISGHDVDGAKAVGHRHAHWWVLPETGARERLCARAVCYVPDGIAAPDLARLRGIRRLHDGQGRFRPVRVVAGPAGNLGQLLPELVPKGGTTIWHTSSPYAPPRHQDRRASWAVQVEAALREEAHLRGLPEVASVRLLAGAWLEFARWRAGQRRADARRAAGVEVTFAEPVHGPLSLGALSHFGLGLFLPGPSSAPTTPGA